MVDILLATYNSEKFLKPQLDSILNQSYKQFKIIISDDGSTDKTLQIVNEYIFNYPDKIELLKPVCGQGAMKNFNYLLQNSTSGYVAFSDHDDVWLEDKLMISINEIEKIEGKDKYPALVFTDKSIVDEELNILDRSSNIAEHLQCDDITLNRLLVQNVASGCTITINRKMRDIIGEIPNEAVMHDHYIILLAKLFGQISFINTPLLLYRQHSRNELGAKRYGFKYIVDKLERERYSINQKFMRMVTQCRKITEIYGDIISKHDSQVVEQFNRLANADLLKFKYILIKNRFLKSGVLRKIGMLILLSNK